MPCTSRARAHPHGRSDSSHPGHPSCPLANLISTATGSASTVTNDASVHQHGPPAGGPPRHSGGRAAVVFVGAILHTLGNLTAPTTSTDARKKINSSSATLVPPRTTFVGVRNAAQHPGRVCP
jgi:hypothetical protein